MNKKSLLILIMPWISVFELYAQSTFSGLEQLAGYCWQAQFADQKKYDTHCFDWMYGQSFIQDRHLVCGDGSNYAGTTIYSANKGEVKYRYYNSLGGISDGEVAYKNDELIFPDETYKNNELLQTYSTTWKLSSNGYVSEMWQKYLDEPDKLIWQMSFKRIDIKENLLITEDDKGRLLCR